MQRIKTKVDWTPKIVGANVKKTKDFSRFDENSLVDAIYNQLIMRKGVITNNRDCGCWEILNSIPFSNDTQLGEIERLLSDQLSQTTDVQVSVELSKDTEDHELIQVLISIEGIPNRIYSMNMVKDNANLILTPPKELVTNRS
jgi:hypothetical protein